MKGHIRSRSESLRRRSESRDTTGSRTLTAGGRGSWVRGSGREQNDEDESERMIEDGHSAGTADTGDDSGDWDQ